ncbi:hypothetical protein RHMOL_Rhmol02G0080900 [Rhododendron molle]|uniref:Uncharacterized protein n=1 Tax=Rhododendron molle TaxID=49168 RepID=A0ACC0PQY0_RHOML|nr:hypothetical protein RHMOL_Rhmol02G0080900 [Rhododendron molle]
MNNSTLASLAQPYSLSSITSSFTRNGKVVEGLPEWDVSIINNCKCPQSNVELKCTAFSTILPVDPAIFKIQGDYFFWVKSGKPILQGHPIKFNIVFRNPSDLKPVSSKIICQRSRGGNHNTDHSPRPPTAINFILFFFWAGYWRNIDAIMKAL